MIGADMDERNKVDQYIITHALGKHEGDLFDALYDDGWDTPEAITEYKTQIETLKGNIERLEILLNTPETKDFIVGVKNEAGHQRWRWGDDHDMRKTAGEWFWTLGFLAQKAMVAAEAGDVEKAKHHTISSGALMANWHRHICHCGPPKSEKEKA